MATLNVFELTNMELKNSDSSDKKTVKESVQKTSKAAKKIKPFAIPASKLKFESLDRFKSLLEDDNAEDSDVTSDYTPDDDVVLVIDPEMDEVPEDVEEAEDAAEELIGAHVCKCAICGANYVTDEELSEDMDVVEETCPVCGEEGDQIVVGVITATDELSDEDKEDIDDVEVTDEEEEEVVDDGEDFEEDEFTEEEEDEDFEESVKRSRMRTMKRRAESVRKPRVPERKRMSEMKKSGAVVPKRFAKGSTKKPVTESDTSFDEVTLNRMLTTFAKENYANVKFVKVSKGTVRGNRLTLEGVVTTTKGSKRPVKFVCENFKMGKRMTLNFKEYGPFTESVENARPTFIIECVTMKDSITPVSLKYSYKTKNFMKNESRDMYSVTGKVLSESVRRNRK